MKQVMRRFFYAVVAGCLAAGAEAATPSLTADQVRARLAEEKSVRSADGLTIVTGKGLAGTDGLNLCAFGTDVRTRLSRLLGIPMTSARYGAGITVIPDGEDGGDGKISMKFLPGDNYPIRLEFHGLSKIDPREAAALLAKGLLLADTAGCRSPAAGGGVFPDWFSEGAARLLDIAVRQDDAELLLSDLESDGLPAIRTLAAEKGPSGEKRTAYSAQLVAWMLDSDTANPEPGVRYRTIRENLATDGAWNWTTGLPVIPEQAETAWIAWLDRRKWTVLTPGSDHPALRARMASLLHATRAEAASSGIDFPEGVEEVSPETLRAHAKEPWAVACSRWMKLRIAQRAAGHGEKTRALAESLAKELP